MIVKFRAPRGCGPDREGFFREVESSFVPRLGETVTIDGVTYRVHVVDSYPFEEEPYVYVVLRDWGHGG